MTPTRDVPHTRKLINCFLRPACLIWFYRKIRIMQHPTFRIPIQTCGSCNFFVGTGSNPIGHNWLSILSESDNNFRHAIKFREIISKRWSSSEGFECGVTIYIGLANHSFAAIPAARHCIHRSFPHRQHATPAHSPLLHDRAQV